MFRRDAFALVALGVFGACLTIYVVIASTPFFPKSLQTQTGECPANSYFPAERRPVMDEFEADWFSSSLVGLHERPLFRGKDRSRTTIRFTLLRSFHAPLAISAVETDDGHVRLSAKLAGGRDGCQGSGCGIDRVLSAEEQARLVAAQTILATASYGCSSGIDGSMWLLEESGRGQYQFWSEWSPQSGALRDLALVMLELTGWNLREIY
jgi:hypothetical protein